MSSVLVNHELLPRLERLLEDNKTAIFEEHANDICVCGMDLSRPLLRREDRYHQILTVRYVREHRVETKKIWLKYRPDFERLFTIHTDLYRRLRTHQAFIPKPYFYEDLGHTSVIGMEVVSGVSLRNLLLKRAAGRSTEGLESLFYRIGRGMRLFHDLSAETAWESVSDLAQPAYDAAAETPYLTQTEKRALVAWIAKAESSAGKDTRLPLINIHNDWVLRNLLVTNRGAFYLVDLDSMRAPNNSRWYDVTYFLINLESQLKYRPIIGRASVAGAWRSFWRGYLEKGMPEGLSEGQISSLIYLIKVRYLVGATLRPPLFEIYGHLLGPRYVRALTRSIVDGGCLVFGGETRA